jgi:hypothetical protein
VPEGELGRPAVEQELRQPVPEVRPGVLGPRQRQVRHVVPAAERRGQPLQQPAPAGPEDHALAQRHRVVHRRDHDLVNPTVHSGRPVGLGDVLVVHVAGEHADRRRRRAAAGDLLQHAGQPVERDAERRQVLEIRGLAHLLAEPGHPLAARPRTQRLVPRLEVVHRPRQQPRQRGRHEQMVTVRSGQLLLDPAGLVATDHRALALVEDPPAAGVDDDQPDRAVAAPVAPPVALGAIGLAVGRGGELVQHRAHVLAVGLLHPAPHLVLGQDGRRQVAQVLVHPVRREPRR